MQFQIQIQTKFRFQTENQYHGTRFKNASNAHVRTLWKVNMEHRA